MKKNTIKKIESKQVVITEDNAGRRIDNYLIRYFDKLPRSRIYQMLRKGEVRVNKGRIKQTYRLVAGDTLRLPPVFDYPCNETGAISHLGAKLLESVVYEDERMLVLNKPAGMVVHSGTGQAHGVIEALRSLGNGYEKLELVHRLDRDTSGCLLLAKDMITLRTLHEQIKNHGMRKGYMALLDGRINRKSWKTDDPLKKNTLQSGERIVRVDPDGKKAITHFYTEEVYENATLVRVELVTGRTHQIRVHSAASGHPVLGDVKYGDRGSNQKFRKLGLKRMFLHAASVSFKTEENDRELSFESPLPGDLTELINKLTIKTKQL